MRSTPTQIAIGLLAAAFVVTAAIARIRDDARLAAARASEFPARFCAGVEHPAHRPGLACADGPRAAVAQAVERLGLPFQCQRVALPDRLRTGDRIAFADSDGECALGTVGRLSGQERLLAGVGLDINRDPEEDLALLPGIGPVKAHRIAERRKNEGPFLAPAEMGRIPGIGEATLRRAIPWVESPAADREP